MAKISRQLAYQRRMRKKGKCPTCGKPATGYFCELHKKIDRERKQEKVAA